ncbi:MAG: hypothetical protein AB7J35_11015 [Dehalococcoidia bacterium]
MCISCGCGKYNESHGDERNITVDTLQRAADASNMTLQQVIGTMANGCADMRNGNIPSHPTAGGAVEERLKQN